MSTLLIKFAGITTLYPSSLYEVSGATSTKHIYAGGILVGTVEGTGTTTLSHTHLDHLGSTNIVTNDIGYTTQVLSYYPYGSTRISNQYGTLSPKKKYIGIERDEETGFDYAQHRYYANVRGQFISQDPVFWSTNQNIQNPQSLNSYSYAEGNPVNRKDPSGLASVSSLYSELSSLLKQLSSVLGGDKTNSNVKKHTSTKINVPSVSSGSQSRVVLPTSAWQTQSSPTGCLSACKNMAGYSPNWDNSIHTATFANGKLTTNSANGKKGIEAINKRLGNGQSVIVGVNWNGGSEENRNPATQHFVTVVGSSVDEKGQYYTFFDPGTTRETAGASAHNRLYVNGDNSLSGSSAYNQATKSYLVTDVVLP